MTDTSTHVIVVRNVNSALHEALWWLDIAGETESSRNGPVKVSPGPVITEYSDPTERVLFSPARDANPYFHLMEALWMLAGRNDLKWVEQFNSKFAKFSDDGETLHAAYGARWRQWWGLADGHSDQLKMIVELMTREPETRRAVLAMWDPVRDINRTYKDLPCNTHAYFDLRHGALNITVCCRSNDALWGAFGANAVQFSMLQEYLASWMKVKVGVYRQFSVNLHAYLKLPGYPPISPVEIGDVDPYADNFVSPYPIMKGDVKGFDVDLQCFMSDPLGDTQYNEPFFSEVVAPMYASWHDRKAKKNSGVLAAKGIKATDWQLGCLEWIGRRAEKK